ncbi:MAG TPA: response regulator [Candidatus Acidoferrales bacterium]
MSNGSIFRFQTQAAAIAGVTSADFLHAALDADASARLAAMDRHLHDDENAEPKSDANETVNNEAANEIDSDDPLAILAQTIEAFTAPVTDPAPMEAASETAQEETKTEETKTEEVAAAETEAPQPVAEESIVEEVVVGQIQAAESVSSAQPEADSFPAEVELAPVVAIQLPVSETIPDVEVNGIFHAVEAATEIILHPAATEVTDDVRVIETEIADAPLDDAPPTDSDLSAAAIGAESAVDVVAAADPDAESEAAPAPLEVAPILDASGELDPNADAYVPPAPFEIHVPESLALEATPTVELPATEKAAEELAQDLLAAQEFEVAQALAAAPQLTNLNGNHNHCAADAAEKSAGKSAENSDDLTETFDLDSICAPTEDEQLEKVIAQEEAVAEMNAAAEEFVAEQIACEEQTGHPCPPPAEDATENNDAPVSIAGSPLESAAAALQAEPASDRRRKRRALISSPIRVRSVDVTISGPDEIATTVDVSRYGILFYTVLDTYQRGMDVAVVFPYHKSATGGHSEQFGRVVRLHDMPDGRHAVAIALGVGIGEHLVDASGRKLDDKAVHLSHSPAPPVKRPLVLIADSDDMLRDTSKIFLQNEGYEVIAVNNAADAREVLNMFTPAMIVAEIEGDRDVLPGLDLCAHVKSSPSLKHIPVVMTSRSAYPSDYSNAHSLGAVVCMAKPYKQERLAHVVHLLAPLPEHLQPACVQRMPDPTRGFTREANVAMRNGNGNGNGKPRNGKKPATNGAAALLKKSFKFPNFR